MSSIIDETEVIQKEAEKKIRIIQNRDRTIAYVRENKTLENEKRVHPCPRSWCLCLPREYKEGEMNYSPEQFQQFEEAIRFGNEQMDRFIQMYINGAIEFATRHAGDNIVNPNDHFWEPVLIGWITYALPNFLNSPRLGKRAYFRHIIGLDLHRFLESAEIGFRVMDIGRELKPLFVGKNCYEGTPRKIMDEMEKLSPEGFDSHITSYYERYINEMPDYLFDHRRFLF